MCGICGICNSKNAIADIRCMMTAIRHRGPDASGEYIDLKSGVAFGHQRLSILDLSDAGLQPMQSSDKRYVLAFNGEIYNHSELKKMLPDKVQGQLKSNTDTEILLELFCIMGIDKTLDMARGIFAIALYDSKCNSIYLIRDRAGEKPLYYGFINGMFVFASELKAIQKVAYQNGISLTINHDAIGMFLRHSYIPAPYSIYNEINKVEIAEIVKISSPYTKIEDSRYYWQIEADTKKLNMDGVTAKLDLAGLLHSAVSEQMIADVPYGAFLSGGIDSSLIVSYMQKISKQRVKTFSIGFESEKYNEAPFAKKVADYIGSDHRELYVTDMDAMKVIPLLTEIYDEPYADSSQIPTYLVSKLAKEDVSVVLTGDAGDELFCGYEHYKIVRNYYHKILKIPIRIRDIMGMALENRIFELINAKTFNNKIDKLSRILRTFNFVDFYYEMLRIDTSKVPILEPAITTGYFKSHVENMSDKDVLHNMQLIDFYTYLSNDILVKVDRAAMCHSLETRVPFLDRRIIEFAYSLPAEYKYNQLGSKAILRELLYDEVPRELLERPKKGFSIPLDSWLRGPLRDWAEDLICSSVLKEFPGLNYNLVTSFWKKHLQMEGNYKTILWNAIMMAQWLQKNKKYYC